MATAPASAGLMIQLRITGVNDFPSSDGSVAFASTGDVVHMDVWAVVTGTNSVNDEGFQSVEGSFTSRFGLIGDLSAARVPPFNALGSQAGIPNDFDSDGDLDIGANSEEATQISDSRFFFARSSTMQEDGVPFGSSEYFLIGSLTLTHRDVPRWSDTSIDFVRRVNANRTNNIAFGTWTEDGVLRNPTNGVITTGPVVIVDAYIPKPSAAALAAVATLGLLVRRREQHENE